MTWDETIKWIAGLFASGILAVLGKWLDVKLTEERRKQLTWALEQGVAYAALKLKDARVSGEAKHREALKVAESLAPKAMGKLDVQQKTVLVDSVYARMKASLPAPSYHRTDPDDIPVDVVEPK